LSRPPLAIVICSRDRAQLLEGALAAIDAARRPGDEVVVVDSASRDASVRTVASRFDGFTVVRSDEPGLARARNCGVRASSAPLIAFTDDDCRPEPHWADVYEDVFRRDPQLGFVTGRVVPDRTEGPMLSIGGRDEPRSFSYGADPVEFGHGANFAVRREALVGVDGFDEALGVGVRFAGGEDHDALWRLLRSGWTGRYEPRIAVVHCQWRSRRQFLRSQYGYGLGSGAFAAKAIRLERRAGLQLLGHRLWRGGALSAFRALRDGNETGAAGDAIRFVGSVVGAASGWRMPLEGDHYAAR
jgi:GT2 family glycosyltransferase